MKLKNIILLFASLSILIFGCVQTPEDIAKTNPIVMEFLEQYPDAELRLTYYSAKETLDIINTIRKDCEKPTLRVKEFYRVKIQDLESNLYVNAWVDWENKIVECAVKPHTSKSICYKDEDCGDLIKCPDGTTYKQYSCHNAKCVGIIYAENPCGFLVIEKNESKQQQIDELNIPKNWLSCEVDSDCIFAKNPSGGCSISINKKYKDDYSAWCEENCIIEEKECFWGLMGCPGSPGNRCINNECKALPCIGGDNLQTEIVSGYVVNGDTTPEGAFDLPRKFIFKIKEESGSYANVAYTAYPPTPTGTYNKIRLSFYAGSIKIGDYLKARGTYNKNTNTLTVAEEGDYIETYSEKP